MSDPQRWKERVPLLKTLAVCTAEARKHARIELYWTVGFALLAVPIVILIVLLCRPLAEIPEQILDVVGRGEIMVYAATVCGAALYSVRHGIDGPVPDALKARVTPIGTLTSWTAILLTVAVITYVVRRMGDLFKLPINDALLNLLSIGVLGASLLLAYIILSLKFALNSGAAPASHEQTKGFSELWESQRGN